MRRVGGWSGRFGSKLSSDDASCLERLDNQLFCKEEGVANDHSTFSTATCNCDRSKSSPRYSLDWRVLICSISEAKE